MDDFLIDKCKEEFKTKFLDCPNKKSDLSSESLNTQEMGLLDEFARFFFIQMSNALFSGEYLTPDYVKKIDDFIQLLSQCSKNADYVLYARGCLNNFKFLVLYVSDKTKKNSKNFFDFVDLAEKQNNQTSSTEYFSSWKHYSLNLAIFDHNLVIDSDIRNYLAGLLCDLEYKRKGLDDSKELVEVFNKLISKCSFLLKKVIAYKEYHYKYLMVNFEEKSLDKMLSTDKYNEDLISLFKEMYPCNIDPSKIRRFQDECYEENYTCLGFIILAHYYGTNKKRSSLERLDDLLKKFEDFRSKYKLDNDFDAYALRTVKNYIYNCRFSLLLKQGNITIVQVEKELMKIEDIQDTTGIDNYHPYKKTLNFIDRYFKDNKKPITQSNLDFYDKVYVKYQDTSESCLDKYFSPFCLPIDESSKNGIFFASSFARPISRQKREDASLNFKVLKQYLSQRMSLSKKEHEIERMLESFNSFRKESFEILGIFIAIVTFLFGGLQLFAKSNGMTLQVAITNIFSLGIIIVMFMSLVYIILSCPKRKIWFLVGALILCFGVLICVNKFDLLK